MFVSVTHFVSDALHISQYLSHSYKLNTCKFTIIEHLTASPLKKVFKKTCAQSESNSEYIKANYRNLVV